MRILIGRWEDDPIQHGGYGAHAKEEPDDCKDAFDHSCDLSFCLRNFQPFFAAALLFSFVSNLLVSIAPKRPISDASM